ncbi:YcaO-like family protein [Vibrio cholerae]
MKSHASIERSFSELEALSYLEKFVYDNFSKVKLIHDGEELKTWFCSIEDCSGRTMSGMGKGIGDQCKISAISEALEHYYYEYDISSVSTLKIRKSEEPEWYYDGSPNFEEILSSHDKEVYLDHYRFSDYLTHEPFYYPCFLGNPAYVPTTDAENELISLHCLHRYSCNSGVASGLNSQEAILHGILELIERDAIGIELINTVISRNAKPVRVIERDSFPAALNRLILDVEKSVGAQVEVYNITSDVNVPSILASLVINKDGARFFGSGASLSLEYAVERAVLESLQCVHGQRNLGYHYPIPEYTGLEEMLPKYTKCYMDKGFFFHQGGKISQSYNELLSDFSISDITNLSVSNQLDYLCNYLRSDLKMNVYERTLFSSSEKESDLGVWVKQVVIPKLERFYLVIGGHFVLPAKRGQRFLD